MTIFRILAAFALAALPGAALAQSAAIDAARAAAAEYDREGARAIVQQACDAGDQAACRVLLADLASSYEETEQAAGRALAQRLCDGGETLGCVTLARLAEYGQGGDSDVSLQRSSLVTACRAGHPSACVQAAYLAEQGSGGDMDPTLMREMAGKGCAAGSGQACSMVGAALRDKGWNVESEAERDAAWQQSRAAYRKGCDLRDRDSCAGLADMLLEGRGGEVDREGAITLLEAQCTQDFYTCETLLNAMKL